jgi:hypothetical protein
MEWSRDGSEQVPRMVLGDTAEFGSDADLGHVPARHAERFVVDWEVAGPRPHTR